MRFVPAQLLAAVFISAPLVAQGPGTNVSGDQIFDALDLHKGQTVCEIGAGDGSLTMAAARLVSPDGLVYTSELGDSRVEALRKNVAASGLTQIKVVSGDPNRTNFPDGACDALFMRYVYHHFADPAAMDASIFASVKPGARVAVADFAPRGHEADNPAGRAGNGDVHGVTADSVSRELKSAGFEPLSISREPSNSESPAQRWFIVTTSKPRNR